MMTVILASDLCTVTGGKAKLDLATVEAAASDAYADPGSPGNCKWLNEAIKKKSAATSKGLRAGLQDRIDERIANGCPIPPVLASAPK